MTAPVWVPAKTGRPRLTDPLKLLAAAREHGLPDLTVGVVTAACGVAYSTFYRSYASIDALIVDYVDEVLEEHLAVPDGLSWAAHLAELARQLEAATEVEPGLADALRRIPTPQRLADCREVAAGLLGWAGLEPAVAEHAAEAVTDAAVWTPAVVPYALRGLAADLGSAQ